MTKYQTLHKQLDDIYRPNHEKHLLNPLRNLKSLQYVFDKADEMKKEEIEKELQALIRKYK